MLHIRKEVQKELTKRGSMQGPVDDLVIEEGREDLRAQGREVVHPITFLLPSGILHILSHLDTAQRVEFP